MISWKIFGGLRSQVDTGFFRPRPQARPRCRFRIVTRAQNRLRFHVLPLKRKQDPLRIFAVVLDTFRLTRVSPSLNRMKFVSLSRWSLAGTPTACVPRSRKTFCTCYISLKPQTTCKASAVAATQPRFSSTTSGWARRFEASMRANILEDLLRRIPTGTPIGQRILKQEGWKPW